MKFWGTNFGQKNIDRVCLLIGITSFVVSFTGQYGQATAQQGINKSLLMTSRPLVSNLYPSPEQALISKAVQLEPPATTIVPPPSDSTTKIEDGEPEEPIITDRPDQTEAPPLTPKGWFQFEFGIQSEFDEDKDTKVKTQSTLYNTTLWKYGLTKSIELRLITEFGEDKVTFKNAKNEDTTTSVSGLNPITVGLKIPLQQEQGMVPDISLITHLELPYIGSADFTPEFVIPRFRFLFAHTLSDRFSLSYNLGGEWEDGTSAATGIYTVSLGMSLAERLAMFVEAYGFTKEKSFPDHRVDAGVTYQLTNDLQFDTSGGFGLTDRSPDYFISAGLSLRFKAFR